MPRNKIAELDKAVASGIWPKRFALNAPLWISGANVQFDEKGVAKMKGYQITGVKIGTTPVRGMFQHLNGANTHLFYGDQTNIYRWNGGSISSVGSGYTGNLDSTGTVWDAGSTTWDTDWDGNFGASVSVWSMTDFGAWVIATNGKDAPQINKTGTFGTLTGPDFTTAEILIKSGPHILCFNTSINSRGFAWCSADDPETWIPTSANSAGDLIIREIDSNIVAAAPIANNIAVYGEKSMFLVRYIGSPLYFGYKKSLSSRGASSKYSVVTVGRKQYVMSEDAFYVTDGSTFQDIDNDDIRGQVFEDFNGGQQKKIIGWHDEENTEIRWYYPKAASLENNAGVGYNYLTAIWTIYTEAKTSAISREVFAAPFSTDADGKLFVDNVGEDANGTAITATLLTKPLDLENADNIKELDAIRIGYVGSGLTFRIGAQNKLSDAISWGSYLPAKVGFDFTEFRKAGRYISIEFKSDGVNDSWELSSIDIYGRLAGTR
tara:strand:+ start:478 stop:1950 length:1473 start_codon:yes stop_codon:yes gene_type:complete